MAFDWKIYTGNLTWLPERTIYVTRHGSHAYGTSLPTSDLDLRGVAIAPKEYYLGFSQVFEQAVQKEPDLVIFEVKKFLKLAAECNPNVLELLYTDESDHLLVTPPARVLLDNRHLFLSRKVKHTFQGYAHAQMKRILTHRRWLLNPVAAPPTRAEFGLPERTVIPADQLAAAQAAIQKQLDKWSWHELEGVEPGMRQAIKDEFLRLLAEITLWGEDSFDEHVWLSAARHIGFTTNFIELLDQERRYGAAHRNWIQFQTWKTERNPARAALEEKFGFDTKHAMHLVRLSRCCEEILTTGQVHVRRDDAEELLGIRAGAWNFEKLAEWFEAQSHRIEKADKLSSLPRSSDIHALNALCMRVVESML
jgi:hypothetical protein